MKEIIYLSALLFIIPTLYGQEQQLINNQNPNYQISLEKYTANTQEYNTTQGTTTQNTYKAIDPLEEKRELKSIKRKYKAQRRLWRHQERLERAKNTTTYNYSEPYLYRNSWWTPYYVNSGLHLLNLGLYNRSCR